MHIALHTLWEIWASLQSLDEQPTLNVLGEIEYTIHKTSTEKLYNICSTSLLNII